MSRLKRLAVIAVLLFLPAKAFGRYLEAAQNGDGDDDRAITAGPDRPDGSRPA